MKKFLEIGKDSSGEHNMLARFIFQNDKYCKGDKLRHGDEEPVILFYLTKDDGTPADTHASSYYLKTLNEVAKRGDGLCLCGATGLSIDAKAVKNAVDTCIDLWEERQARDYMKALDHKAIDMIEDFGTEPQHLMAVANALATITAYEADLRSATVALPALFSEMADAWVNAMAERDEDGNLE